MKLWQAPLILIIISVLSSADEITLTNGKVIYGAVKEYHAGVGFKVELENGDTILFKDNIFSIVINRNDKSNYTYDTHTPFKDTINKVVMSHIKEVREVYKKAVIRNPSIKGKIFFRFRVSPEGSVVSCEYFEPEFKDVNFSNTLVKMIKTWKFGKISDNPDTSEVVYPFVF